MQEIVILRRRCDCLLLAIAAAVFTLFSSMPYCDGADAEAGSVSLNYEGKPVDGQALDAICRTEGLRRLNLSRTHAANGTLARLASIGSLEVLELRACNIGPTEVQTLSQFRGLRVLDLSAAQGVDGHGAFRPLVRAANLEELRLLCNYTDDEDLLDISRIPNLRALRITSAEMSDRGLAHLSGMRSLHALELYGDPRRVSDRGAEFLLALGELRELTFRVGGLDGSWLRYVAELKHLELLDASSTGVSNSDLMKISSSVSLLDIDLSGCDIDENGLKAISRFADLGVLRLNNTKVGERGIDVLKSLKQLRRVELPGQRRRCNAYERRCRRRKLPRCPKRRARPAAPGDAAGQNSGTGDGCAFGKSRSVGVE
jgi:hypothetical protein